MVVFEANRGRVVKVDDPTAQATFGFIGIEGRPIAYETRKSIITRVTVQNQANVQFLHSVGSFVHIYVFGDRIGDMSLSGLSFRSTCDDRGQGELGLEQMLRWYRENRVSETGQPVRVQVGIGTTIDGFVVGSSFDVVEAETGISQWNVSLKTLPER